MIIIGVDPGKQGGLAWFQETMEAMKMPATETDLSDLLKHLKWARGSHAYLEKVHAMPGQGVTSMFTFGQGYGFLRGCLIAHGIPFDDVTPQRWQKSFSLKRKKDEPPTAWKNRIKAKAQQLFPHLKVTLMTADALLICEYGRRLRAGEVAA